jgi:hypothetical protein
MYVLSGQSPGTYKVVVRTSRGGIFARREMTITGPADARQTVELSLLQAHGVVTMGGEPMAAELLFGGQSGSEQITASAGDDGRFKVSLPRPGSWTVDVRNAGEGIHAPVEVEVSEHEDELTIELPETEVAGWVVDPDGARVPTADVVIHSKAGTVSKRAESNGEFRFRGIAPGHVTVMARDLRTGESSPSVEVTAQEKIPLLNTEVRLESRRDINGIVVSQGQPVIGARVIGYGIGAGATLAQTTVTALDGTFRVPIRTSASEIVFIVAAAGRTLQAFSVPPNQRTPRLEIESAGGTLRLRLTGGAVQPWLTYNNTTLPISDLLGWARAQGSPVIGGEVLTVPNVAPGLYRLCFKRSAGAPETCRQQTLARGASAELNTE